MGAKGRSSSCANGMQYHDDLQRDRGAKAKESKPPHILISLCLEDSDMKR
jgi:hypothetical protein